MKSSPGKGFNCYWSNNGVLRICAKFTREHLCQSLFLSNVAGLRSVTLLKKRLWHKCFPVDFAKSPRAPFLTEHLRWQLLVIPKVSMPIDIFLKQCMAVSYIITTWATYQCDYINTRKCGNITALGNLQTKRGPLKFPQVLFLIISGSSTPFLITPTPGYCKSCQHFHSPRKFHILNPPMAAIIIKSSMYSYTTLYAIY